MAASSSTEPQQPLKQRLRDDWDPVPFINKPSHPTAQCKKRVHADVKKLYKEPLPGVLVLPDAQPTVVHAIVTGPENTPYQGGFFYFMILCPDDYPNEAPKVKLMTTGQGAVRFNPNLYANGKVCLSILGTWVGPKWSSALGIGSILLSIQSLLNGEPYRNEPGYDDAGPAAVQMYNLIIRHETIRVAVLDMVNDSGYMTKVLPEVLREQLESCFMVNYSYYVKTCEENKHMDGALMTDPFGETRGRYQWGKILEEVEKLKEKLVAKGVDPMDDEEDDEEVTEDKS